MRTSKLVGAAALIVAGFWTGFGLVLLLAAAAGR